MPMKADGSNLPISHLMTPGKPTVPDGIELQKLTGKKLKASTKTGRRLRAGSLHRAGLPLSYTDKTQEKYLEPRERSSVSSDRPNMTTPSAMRMMSLGILS